MRKPLPGGHGPLISLRVCSSRSQRRRPEPGRNVPRVSDAVAVAGAQPVEPSEPARRLAGVHPGWQVPGTLVDRSRSPGAQVSRT